MRARGLSVVLSLGVVCLSPTCGGNGSQGDADVADAIADADKGEVVETCPPGLVSWLGGGCAPQVDECANPWELPLIGGGCLPIGPRACPKTWDPEADVDCEAGTLMEYDGNACPEGFVLTDDEVACIPFFEENCEEMEIPVLGGGCQKVGPDWYDPEAPGGGLDVPYFDECGPGLLALEGGGCIQVGPRACPKLWDPDADVDCEVGDVLPCPEGWSESEDGMYCDPKYGECGPGERSLVGGGCKRVVPLAEDCPPGPFPAVPQGAKEVVYASAASVCTEGCGMKEAPFPTISAALDEVPNGGYVLVGEGEYAEGLAISKPVHVFGLCSAKVAITGAVAVESKQKSKVDTAGIAVTDTTGVELAGLTVTSPVPGVAIVGAKEVHIHDMEIAGSSGVGLYAGPGGQVLAERMWLHDTVVGSKSWLLFGVYIQGGATLELKDSVLDAVRGAGVYASEAASKVSASRTTVRDTEATPGGVAGYGVRVEDGATVTMAGCLLERNRDVGALVRSGALSLSECGVRSMRPTVSGAAGWGVLAQDGGNLTIESSLIEGGPETALSVNVVGAQAKLVHVAVLVGPAAPVGLAAAGVQAAESGQLTVAGCVVDSNPGAGVAAWHSGTHVAVHGSVVRGVAHDEGAEPGLGMEAREGAAVEFNLSLAEGNVESGVRAGGAGSQADLLGSVVRSTGPNAAGKLGMGLDIWEGGTGTAFGCLLEHNAENGALAEGAGTVLDLVGTVVRNTEPNEKEEFGRGICVSGGASVSVAQCLLHHNHDVGLLVADEGSVLELSQSWVHSTQPTDSGGGMGAAATQGATLKIDRAQFEANPGGGVAAWHSGTQAQVRGTVVRTGTSDMGDCCGRGAEASLGAHALVADCLFEANCDKGLLFIGAGTMAEVTGTSVRGTVSDSVGEGGQAVAALDGAAVSMAGSLLAGNQGIGAWFTGEGTTAEVVGTVVRDTIPVLSGEFGRGVEVSGAASVTLDGCLLEGNSGAGTILTEPDSRGWISATIIHETKPDGTGQWGRGLGVQMGASAEVAGCLFDGNSEVGLNVAGKDSETLVFGSLVRLTRTDAEGLFGAGMAVSSGASVSAVLSLSQGNSTLGAGVWDARLELDRCAVLNTSKGGGEDWTDNFEVFGDGILALAGGQMDMVSTLVAGSGRNGIYFNKASGSATDSIITGNDFYGLAMEECADQVQWDGNGNYIVGNAKALPPDKAVQVTTSTGGMAVPPAPEMMEIDPDGTR